MKKLTLIGILTIGIILIGTATAQAKISAQADKLGYIPGEVIIVLKSGSNLPAAIGGSGEYSLVKKEKLFGKVYKLKFSKDVDMGNLKEWLEGLDEIKSVEFNRIIKQQTEPIEKLDNKWGLKKIEATSAWNYETGSKDITIAVIDSGIDTDHEDLKNNITLGEDYVDGGEPIDTTGDSHGTHVAGIIAAVGDNDKGTVGVMWKANLLIVRALDEDGESPVDRMIEAITETADKDVDIINMSWGVMSFSPALEEAIDYANSKGCILIAAAGNNSVESPFYPAGYDNVIGVAASNKDDKITSFSNYGDKYEIAAPGVGIYSTIDGGYGRLDGTSMAAGFVTGVAGLLLSKKPGANVESILLETADSIDTDKQPNRRVNAYKAIKRAHEGEESTTGGEVKAEASVGEVGQKSIEVKVGEEVQFYSDGSTAPEGEELSYIWVFGDGSNISQDEDPTHVFDKEGNFEVELLVFSKSGIDTDKVEVNVNQDTGKAIITGKVTDRDTGEPIEAAIVYAKIRPGDRDYLIQAVKVGYYDGERIKQLSPGDEVTVDFELELYDFSAAAEGKKSGYITIASTQTEENGEYKLEFEVKPQPEEYAIIRGQVKDSEGDPVEGAKVIATRTGPYPVPMEERTNTAMQKVIPPRYRVAKDITDEEGKYKLEIDIKEYPRYPATGKDTEGEPNMPPPYSNRFRITASKSGYKSESRRITLNAGEEKEVNFTLRMYGVEKKAVIYGKVTDEEGGAIEGAKVVARWPFPPPRPMEENGKISSALLIEPPPDMPPLYPFIIDRDTTDKQGKYRLEISIPPYKPHPAKPEIWPPPYKRNVQVRVTKSGYITKSRRVSVSAGEEKEVNFTLRKYGVEKKAVIYGKVKDSEGDPIEGAKVVARWPFPPPRPMEENGKISSALLIEPPPDMPPLYPFIIDRDTTDKQGKYRLEISIPPYKPHPAKPEIWPPPYKRSVQVRVTKSGYITKSRRVSVSAGEEKEVNFTLDKVGDDSDNGDSCHLDQRCYSRCKNREKQECLKNHTPHFCDLHMGSIRGRCNYKCRRCR